MQMQQLEEERDKNIVLESLLEEQRSQSTKMEHKMVEKGGACNDLKIIVDKLKCYQNLRQSNGTN